jgi:hypothetical protein
MIGIGVSIPNIAILGARDDSPPPESIVRTAKGVARSEESISPDYLSIANLPLAPNSDLLVFLASDYAEAEPETFQWGAEGQKHDLIQIFRVQFGDDSDLRVWHLHDALGGEGCLELQYGGEYPSAVVLAAVQYQGLAVPSLDRSKSNAGVGSAADSGLTLETTQAHELILGCVAMAGPEADTPGAWQDGLTGGQRVGNIVLLGGGMDVVLHEGYAIVQVQGQYRAHKTGMTARPWGAICLSLKGAA